MNNKELTERQTEIYNFIINFREENGYSPSFREIGRGCYLASKNAVCRHIDILVRKGYLEYVPHISRSIKPKK